MENKITLKRYCIFFLVTSLIFLIITTFINLVEYNSYKVTLNSKFSSVIDHIKEKYPNITDEEIIDILNSDTTGVSSLKEYGYDIEKDSFILTMKKNSLIFISLELIIFVLSIIVLLSIFLIYEHKKNNEIKKITKIIENINHKNYNLELEDYREDDLSILKSEIYKTTIMLKEIAENSIEDKINLKNTLSDISHQLKTPLTSILIMLENIADEDMDKNTRQEFIKDIKSEILKINFLVASILKLSKFESNTVSLLEENVSLSKIVDESVKNVSPLCDLKNIKFEVSNNTNAIIKCDLRWQVEALTNIIKNAIEHSSVNSTIKITITENSVYKQVSIQDFGAGIDSVDLEHIFERFYKSKNSNKDSIGIGLELAKKIIETVNGKISVKSELDKGTTFTIKYFNI